MRLARDHYPASRLLDRSTATAGVADEQVPPDQRHGGRGARPWVSPDMGKNTMERVGPRRKTRLAHALMVLLIAALAAPGTMAAASSQDDEKTATMLAEMLRALRTVVAKNRNPINNPDLADKGLTGDVVLSQTVAEFRQKTGIDPAELAPNSRDQHLVTALESSIREVVDDQQSTINAPGVGFKAFIPAVVARMVNQAFNEKMGEEATLRVTAPPELVRNRQARPDAWETAVIRSKFEGQDWPKGQPFSEATTQDGRAAFRSLAPEYYGAGCLSCHGEPKGELDITGYPKEGGKLGQLGSAISVTLFR